MANLRLGLIGSGFMAGFHLRALRQVRGVEVSGLTARRRPEALAAWANEHGLGPARACASIEELAPLVDALLICGPNFTRVEDMERIAAARRAGAELKAVFCEKPLARNLAEARRMIELVEGAELEHLYFENQLHMKAVQAERAQLAPLVATMGPPVLTRAAEEHAGPHSAWFWDPTRQGGGVLSDMGCHCIALGSWALTPPGKPADHLEPVSVSADLSLLKWGQPRWRAELEKRFGLDYAATPAEDFATGIVTWRDPATRQLAKSQFTTSWMYEKQGLRLSLDGIGPGYAFEFNSLRSGLEVFVGDSAAASLADADAALEKSTATRGLLAVQPNEPDLYGYTDESEDALAVLRGERTPLMDWHYGARIVELIMAAYLSAERGRTIDLNDPDTKRELERYVPLIQQGRGAEQLEILS